MSKQYVGGLLGVAFLLASASPVFAQYADHKGISFQAVIKKSNGSYPNVSGITVIAQMFRWIHKASVYFLY